MRTRAQPSQGIAFIGLLDRGNLWLVMIEGTLGCPEADPARCVFDLALIPVIAIPSVLA